jgi:pantetheine-phosphate adenylyltransferase
MSASNPVVAVYPGSFDPITRGHEDIVRRALRVADHLIVAVAHTATQSKSSLFAVDERLQLIREVFAGEERVEACAFEGLLVDFARARGVRFVIRGLRAVSDFEYELQMTQMNRELWPELDTIFLAPEVDFSFLSASLVREVARLGGDVSRFVRPVVAEHVRAKVVGE